MAGCWGVQVPAQFPSFSDVRRTGMSPLSKPTVTPPAIMGLAQSSITFTDTCAGKPPVTLLPFDSCVNTGASVVGLHDAVVRGCSAAGNVDPEGITTSTSETARVFPSEKDRVKAPR